MDEWGSRDGSSLSEKAPWMGPWGEGAPSLGTLEDMLRKAPDTGISLSLGAPFQPRRTWNQEGGLYTGDFEG
jgi:hypothetical protein